ncbi:UDP-glucuronosyltransferase 2B15-like isoform X1 [Belonocnema kinseyi]|uniref:UDP-glucuronosyltransferase 2B15-like isoform X1 n=1 Tax=Belonocnema kinseyi TaxID=2817044 RepID=UPI00143D5540|nr:UDP-glucuronosyltransferase 2B15-like isoform X1 [Belonocnema kinseyi]
MVCFNSSLVRNKMFFGLLLLIVLKSYVLTSQENFSSKLSATTKEKLKILAVYHHPGKSHFDFSKPLLEELAHRGHEMTVISYFPRNVNLTETGVILNYKDINLSGSLNKWINVIDLATIDSYSINRILMEIFQLRQWSLDACKAALNNPDVRALIKSDKKFDLILVEEFNSDCFLGFIHRFPVPFISISAHKIMPWANQRMGNPDNPSYIPSINLGLSSKMNFIERTVNTAILNYLKFLYDTAFLWSTQRIVEDAFGPGVPPLGEIGKKSSGLLTNTHFSLFGARPLIPNVIEVGGLHIRDVKPLPDDINKFLNEASEGVLLFSWGSMVKASSLPKEKLSKILRVIASIPRKVIWKWEVSEIPERPKNLMIVEWLPQFDIMNHPNVKAYLSHGGLLGLSEGVYVGIPMVIVPMYGDQFHNAAAAAARGAAVIVRYDELDEITLKSALDKVFNDTRYQENARALSRAYRDRPASPLETAVWWSEFIARGNGRPYLRSEGADLPWYQYYLLDVFLFLTVILLTAFYATYRLMKFLLFLCCFRKSCKTTESSSAIGKKTKRKNE